MNHPPYVQLPESETRGEDEPLAALLLNYQNALCTFDDFCSLAIEPRKPLLGKWMKEGDTGFLFGQRGSGKTWLSDLIISHLSSGRDIDEDWNVPQQIPVVLLDGEMPSDDTKARLKGLGADGAFLRILHHEVLFDRSGVAMNLTNPLIQKDRKSVV